MSRSSVVSLVRLRLHVRHHAAIRATTAHQTIMRNESKARTADVGTEQSACACAAWPGPWDLQASACTCIMTQSLDLASERERGFYRPEHELHDLQVFVAEVVLDLPELVVRYHHAPIISTADHTNFGPQQHLVPPNHALKLCIASLARRLARKQTWFTKLPWPSCTLLSCAW
eukprot:2871208-Rhodomonas_salina.3